MILGGSYRVVRAIPGGSLGSLYEGVDASGRRVAMKALVVGRDPADLEALYELACGPVVAHRGLLAPLDVLVVEGGLVIVSELVAGGSLAAALARRGRFRAPEVAEGAALVADALAALHGGGLAHGDVKPSNILLLGGGRPVLAEVGIRSWMTADGVGWQASRGTAEYVAPEVWQGGLQGAASDVYGLGVVCWEALVGRPPFCERTPLATIRAAARGNAPTVSSLQPAVPIGLGEAVQAAMALSAADRPSAAELAAELRAGLSPCVGPRRITTGAATPRVLPRVPGRPARPRPARPRPALSRPAFPGRLPSTRTLLRLLGALGVVVVGFGLVSRMLGTGGRAKASPPRPTSSPVAQAASASCQAQSPAAGAETLFAHVFGTACLRMSWANGVLTLPRSGAGNQRRFVMGRPGDELLVGDWGCRGSDTAAVYRPGTGQVFVWDGWASPGRAAAPARVFDTGIENGVATTVTSPSGPAPRGLSTKVVPPAKAGCAQVSVTALPTQGIPFRNSMR
ncbi:MAG: serine/threonine protein kinase [Acidimicrobiales bacterium]